MAGKLLAGHAVRRLRRGAGLTQVALAAALDISPSYLNLIERNQRPLSAGLMLRLAERFDFDPRALGADEPGGGMDGLRRRLSDPMFADLNIDRTEIEEWLAAAPGGAEAFARAFDRAAEGGTRAVGEEAAPIALVRREIERWRNHFADLDAQAEGLADELRLSSGDLYGAIAERLRVKHQFAIRILPANVMPDRVRRLDLHARQLQISEMLDGASRCFQVAYLLADLEAIAEINALVTGAALADRTAERLFRRHLTGYFAAALMMPYARFLRACEGSGYDLLLLQRRFNAGFEQVSHRLTTLQRVGSRGLPFFMLRIDRAGQVSKRYAGASASLLVEAEGRCPLWDIHAAFARPGEIVRQVVALEDGERWFTMARTVAAQGAALQGGGAMFAIALGLKAEFAAPLLSARGIDLQGGEAQPVGPGCSACTRELCAQRSAPPRGRALRFSDRERGLSPFSFSGD
ncbi:MAG: short-chain fatty acyl-CoA regulator family protein [Pseudomonadota bacterium]|uniref:helix-turn-helix domain-containing protein n=1 Tax=Sphingobium sp. BS19 TaxID=3018973 RepID=UPI0024922320|nr:helix-turn-helix transcriptional regulator [Sphingobium sp. BS19]|tara:strand:+ start:947 stop:2335 length:1389 start_codon:yes stop_codon:yes gene_type:complete